MLNLASIVVFSLSVKIIETGGVSLKSQLVRTDMSGCLFPDCRLCESDVKGGSHTRRGCVYEGICKLCRENNFVAAYHGESGRNAYHRINQHANDIENSNSKNAFVKHIMNKHEDHKGDPNVFEFKVYSTYRSCLYRQGQEGVNIAEDNSDELLNSKTEFHQPSVTRVTTTREVASVRSHGGR